MRAGGATSGEPVRNTAVPGTRVGFDFHEHAQEVGHRESNRVDSWRRAAPCRASMSTSRSCRGAEQDRHPAAVENLHEIGGQERQVDGEEHADEDDGRPRAVCSRVSTPP